MCAKAVKGERVTYSGSYGETYTEVPPIPENPPTIVDKWGWKWLYLGDIDEYTIRIAKPDKNGLVDIVSLGPKNRDHFPCLYPDNKIN